MIGIILCRGVKYRKDYYEARLVELRAWLARVKGLLVSLRNRSYCNDELIVDFIRPLEEMLDDKKWEDDVFSVVERTFSSLKEYQPNPTDFAASSTFVKLDADEVNKIKKEWNSTRVDSALTMLHEVTGKQGITYVGMGSEAVSFRVDETLYKVFDQDSTKLPMKIVKLLGSSYVGSCHDRHPVLTRPFYSGTVYRGGHGVALVVMLREWKKKKLYHTNLTPDNLVLDENGQVLRVVDIGRDVKYEESEYMYQPHL